MEDTVKSKHGFIRKVFLDREGLLWMPSVGVLSFTNLHMARTLFDPSFFVSFVCLKKDYFGINHATKPTDVMVYICFVCKSHQNFASTWPVHAALGPQSAARILADSVGTRALESR